jgi:hypothetical protein
MLLGGRDMNGEKEKKGVRKKEERRILLLLVKETSYF